MKDRSRFICGGLNRRSIFESPIRGRHQPDFRPYLFERFTQADPSITRNSGGLGMGLAIAKNIVELHGGVVSASSEGIGKGTTFVVKLPISAVRLQERHPEPVQMPILNNRLKFSPEVVGLKILVVDDEPDTCELIPIIREERQSRTLAVALTALARIEDRLKALSAGFQMHVPARRAG